MSRHYLSLISIFAVFILSACTPSPKPSVYGDFAKEDELTLLAYDALINKSYADAQHYFDELFSQTSNPVYLQEYLRVLYFEKQFNPLIQKSQAYLAGNRDAGIHLILIEALKLKEAYEQAIVELEKLLDYEKSEAVYLTAGELYALAGHFDDSIRYYKEAYELNPSDYCVDKIAEILYLHLKKAEEAIRYYETHIRFHGCTQYLCQRMASLYAKEGNIDGVISAYRRIYDEEKNEVIGRKVIDLYLLKNDQKGLQEFLETSRVDDVMLLRLLKHNREYQKAAGVALRLYQSNGEIDYLAQHAMFRFESGDQKNKKLINETIAKLRDVVKESNSHIYLNYLGYLLIDNDIDVKEGIDLVNRALQQDADNVSYLDSLAWGYYKQKHYTKAYKVIKRVKNTLEDPVVKEHYNKIKKRYDALKKK